MKWGLIQRRLRMQLVMLCCVLQNSLLQMPHSLYICGNGAFVIGCVF